jgi:hypothetical protein
MDMRTVFPSPWYSASDFDGVGKEFTIGNIMMQQVAAEFKPVMYFNGVEKALVLNPTNNKLLIAMFGPDSKEWTGKKVVLYSFTAMFGGQPQLRLGVRAADESGRTPPAEPATGTQVARAAAAAQQRIDDMNDEVPF